MDGSLKAPGPLSAHGAGWETWVSQYDFYMRATEKDKKSGPIQVATLLTLLGPDGMEVFRSLRFDRDEDKDDIGIVKTKLGAHYMPRKNETFERYQFLKRRQATGEPFEAFLASLMNLISSCGYHPDEKDKIVRDQIVMGVHQDTVRERLLAEDGLTLTKAVNICRTKETTDKYSNCMSFSADKMHAADAMSRPYRPKQNSTQTCRNCGTLHAFRHCIAYGQSCRSCGKLGHFQKYCRSTQARNQSSQLRNQHSQPRNQSDQSRNQTHAVHDTGCGGGCPSSQEKYCHCTSNNQPSGRVLPSTGDSTQNFQGDL